MANQPVQSGGERGTAGVLRISNYRLAWPALVTAQMGRMMWIFASGYLIFKLTNSSFLTNMVSVTFAAPQFLLSVVSGTISDAYDRRWLLALSLLLMAVVTFTATALAFTGKASALSILGLSVIIGTLFTVNNVTRGTFTFDVVGSELLPSAMALDNIGLTVGFIMGPFLGGVLLDLAPGNPMRGATYSYLAIAVFYALGGVMLLFVRPTRTQAKKALGIRSGLSSTAEGLRVVRNSTPLIGIMGITVLFNFVFPPHRALIPVFGESVLHIGPTAQGILGAAQGIGSLIGAAYLATRGIIKRRALYYWVGACVVTGFLAVFAAQRAYPLAVVALIASGVGQSWFGTMQATLVLSSVQAEMRGRVMGILSMAIGVQTLGSLAVGLLSDSIGAPLALFLMAGTGTVSLLLWVYCFRQMRRL